MGGIIGHRNNLWAGVERFQFNPDMNFDGETVCTVGRMH